MFFLDESINIIRAFDQYRELDGGLLKETVESVIFLTDDNQLFCCYSNHYNNLTFERFAIFNRNHLLDILFKHKHILMHAIVDDLNEDDWFDLSIFNIEFLKFNTKLDDLSNDFWINLSTRIANQNLPINLRNYDAYIIKAMLENP